MTPEKLQELYTYAWDTFYRDEPQTYKMFKLLQKVMEKEKADGTYRGRRRELMTRRFGTNGRDLRRSVMKRRVTEEVIIGEGPVTLSQIVAVARGKASVKLSRERSFQERIRRSEAMLHNAIRDGIPVYGVSTGFGKILRQAPEARPGAEAQGSQSHPVSWLRYRRAYQRSRHTGGDALPPPLSGRGVFRCIFRASGEAGSISQPRHYTRRSL